MEENKNKELKEFPIDALSVKNLNNRLNSKNSFYINRSYAKDSSFVVDWQMPKKKVDNSIH